MDKPDTTQLTLGSLFDGIAGFPLAAKKHGIKTVWASEIEANCVDIVEKHFTETKQLGDITKIKGDQIPEVDIISFGSPCQNLSTAGNQEGLDGAKSSLFFEAIRIIYEMRGATNGEYPKYIIWENVAGAFSSNKGQDFRRVIEEITKTYIPMPNSKRWASAGMVRSGGGCTAWRQLDAQYWGVPQRRKRIYLVHSFGNERAGKVLFECESMLGYTAQGRTEGQDTSRNIGNSTERANTMAAGFKYKAGAKAGSIAYTEDKAPTLLAGQQQAVIYSIAGNAIGRTGKNGGNQLGISENISYTLTAADRHAVAVPQFHSYRLSGYGDYKEGVGTLRASGGDYGGGSENLVVAIKKFTEKVKYIVRRLIPIECERLDGFPDDWTKYGASGKEMADTTRYTALGNSIAVPCTERVFAGIVEAEKESK
jgi:DNA (cytosine-5)-methyltransferase 1